MSDANPEVAVLWRGEGAIRGLLQWRPYGLTVEDRQALQDLLVELERIRLMRVARWNARKRAKQAKRRSAIQEKQRADQRARQLLERSGKRDQVDGLAP